MKKILLFIVLFTVGVMKVSANADEFIQYINNPGYTIDVQADVGTAGATLKILLKNYTQTENTDYYVMLTEDKANIPLTTDSLGCASIPTSTIDFTKALDVVKSTGQVRITNDWFIIDGYTKAFVIKRYKDSDSDKQVCEVINEPITLTKRDLPPLGQRYQIYLDKDAFSVYQLFPFEGSSNTDLIGSQTVITKIGAINDSNIIKKFAKNESDAYTTLLAYAKANTGKTFTFPEGDSHNLSYDDFTVTNGTYYFIYTTYKNDDNVYRNLEDVSIAMGKNNSLINDAIEYNNYDQTDLLWENFVEKFKANQTLKEWSNTTNYNLEITSTDELLKIVTTGKDVDNNSFSNTTEFKYQNGIITHVGSTQELGATIDGFFMIPAVIEAFAQVKSYDFEALTRWIEEHPDATLEKDGIEIKELNIVSESPEAYVAEGEELTLLKLDLKNGLKTFTNPITEPPTTTAPKKESNPNTGIDFKTGLLLLIIASGVVGYYVTYKNDKFPQA